MKQLFNQYNITISDKQVNMFNDYYKLLIEWNSKINLTTITEYDDVIKKHFIDSSLLVSKISIDKFTNKRIIDVGTGAGFPGIPLAILMPNTSFTLIDSLNKRINFLENVIDILKLNNVKLVLGRAEDCGKELSYREQFDYCISRAVAETPLLMEYCSPFINVGGSLLLYKSKKVQDEINHSEHAFSELNCKYNDIILLCNEPEYERYLLVIDKFDHTPDKYPRRAGIPKKKPL